MGRFASHWEPLLGMESTDQYRHALHGELYNGRAGAPHGRHSHHARPRAPPARSPKRLRVRRHRDRQIRALHLRQPERDHLRLERLGGHDGGHRSDDPGRFLHRVGHQCAGDMLYAAKERTGKIDVFNGSFAPTTVPGGFVDPPSTRRRRPLQRARTWRQGLCHLCAGGAPAQTTATAGMGLVDVIDESGTAPAAVHRDDLAPPGAWRLRRELGPVRRRPAGRQFQLRRQRNRRLQPHDRAWRARSRRRRRPCPGGLWPWLSGAGAKTETRTPLLHRRLNSEHDGLFGAINERS